MAGNGEETGLHIEVVVRATYARAHGYMKQGDLTAAAQDLEKVIDLVGFHEDAMVHLARCRAALNEEEEALQLLARVLKARPGDASLRVHAGDIGCLIGRWNYAVEAYSEAIAVADEAAQQGMAAARGAHVAYKQRAKLHMSRGKFREAMLDLRKAVNLKASDREGCFDRDLLNALCIGMGGDFKGAVITLGTLLQQCQQGDHCPSGISSRAEVFLLRGVFQWHRGLHTKAMEDFLEATNCSNGLPGLHLSYNLMVVCLQSKVPQGCYSTRLMYAML